jgi:hypothetical protein
MACSGTAKYFGGLYCKTHKAVPNWVYTRDLSLVLHSGQLPLQNISKQLVFIFDQHNFHDPCSDMTSDENTVLVAVDI